MKQRGVTLASPAKVNLFLRILGRRPDGYHELASLFQAVDLCDILHIALADTDSLTCSEPSIPVDASNLVLKAVAAFRRRTPMEFGAQVHIDKRIPIQAGLGGGSSNAATTLWALNELLGHPLTEEGLLACASEIGSDVSFFLSQGTAYCTGRGEHVHALPPIPSQKLLIVKPHEGLSTPEVYRRLDVKCTIPRDPTKALDSFMRGTPTYFNDLEAPAFEALPRLGDIKRRLQQSGYSDVLLSGSGTSFFCVEDESGQHHPDIADATCYRARFIRRSANAWYGSPTVS